MNLFSEVYSCYYQVVGELLRRSLEAPLSRPQMAAIIDQEAFAESALYILPRLTDGTWPLMAEQADRWQAIAGPSAPWPLSSLQRAWLKSLLLDPRIGLFLTPEQAAQLSEALAADAPLYDPALFYDFDHYAGGDPYGDSGYQGRFRQLLAALAQRQVLSIHFHNGHGQDYHGDFLPLRLEYSRKDDRFRLYAGKIRGQRFRGLFVINLGRIQAILPSREQYYGDIDLERQLRKRRCAQPVVLRISLERNGLERAMLHFASYQKETFYDEEDGCYRCRVYYDKNDETELLIRILSFGPVVQVLGPEPFLQQIRQRVRRQYALLHSGSGPGDKSL